MRNAAVLLVSGIATAAVGGFFAVVMLGLIELGLRGLVGGIFFGFFGAVYAVPVATLPAALLGGLLTARRVQHRGLWAVTGAAAGLGCFALAHVFPGAIGEIVVRMAGPTPLTIAPAFAAAGASAALLFRTLAYTFGDYDVLLDEA